LYISETLYLFAVSCVTFLNCGTSSLIKLEISVVLHPYHSGNKQLQQLADAAVTHATQGIQHAHTGKEHKQTLPHFTATAVHCIFFKAEHELVKVINKLNNKYIYILNDYFV